MQLSTRMIFIYQKVTQYHQGYLPLSHSTERSVSVSQFTQRRREDFARSRILYFPEEGTLEAQAPYLTRILSLCYLPLCKETGGTKDTACYQIERLSRCSVGMVTRGNETPVNKNNGRGVSKVSRVCLPPFSTLTIMLVN